MKASMALTEARSNIMRMPNRSLGDFRPELRAAYDLGFNAARIAARDLINETIREQGGEPMLPILKQVRASILSLEAKNVERIAHAQRATYRHGFAGGRRRACDCLSEVLALYEKLERE